MMFMTAKVDLKKILLIAAGAAALILAVLLLLGGGSGDSSQPAAPDVTTNDGRIRFLKDFGWEVITSPKESGQVTIPAGGNQVFDRYNLLQKSQGYDLSSCAGKNVMRYVYEVTNLPGATAPVYATVLVHQGQIIGGDVTDTSPGGRIHGFRMPEETQPSTADTTVPVS